MAVKAPFNYIGNKYRIINSIQEYFPEEIDTFVDIFAVAVMSASIHRLIPFMLMILTITLLVFLKNFRNMTLNISLTILMIQ